MKFPIRFYCALGVSAAITFRVILTKISKRTCSGNAVQWNGGIRKFISVHAVGGPIQIDCFYSKRILLQQLINQLS